jgi:nucleoside-diphosphate-sugar epimerase
LTDIAWEQGWLPTGGRLKVNSLPWPLIRVGSMFNPVWAALLEMRYLLQRPHRLVNTKLQRLIGQEPHTPLPQAVRDTLARLGLVKQTSGSLPVSVLVTNH